MRTEEYFCLNVIPTVYIAGSVSKRKSVVKTRWSSVLLKNVRNENSGMVLRIDALCIITEMISPGVQSVRISFVFLSKYFRSEKMQAQKIVFTVIMPITKMQNIIAGECTIKQRMRIPVEIVRRNGRIMNAVPSCFFLFK